MADDPEDKHDRSMADIARDLQELFSDPKLRYTSQRYWLYDAERGLFYRDPFVVELEKIMDEELGIEHWEQGDAPRPAR